MSKVTLDPKAPEGAARGSTAPKRRPAYAHLCASSEPEPRVVLHIPEVPVAKARPRMSRYRGPQRVYTPLPTARAEQRIREHARAQLGEGWVPLSGPLSISVTVLRPLPKEMPKRLWATAVPACRPDLTNYLKLIEDALTLGPDGWGVVRDDAQFVAIINAKKLYALGCEPGWEVVIEPFTLEVPT